MSDGVAKFSISFPPEMAKWLKRQTSKTSHKKLSRVVQGIIEEAKNSHQFIALSKRNKGARK